MRYPPSVRDSHRSRWADVGAEKTFHLLTGMAVCCLRLGGDAIAWNGQFVIAHVGVVRGEEHANVGREAGDDQLVRAEKRETQPFAKAIAELVENQLPDLVVSSVAKTLRRGKVLIDWSQNSDFKTTVCVYAMRAKEGGPFISMPVK